MITAKTEYRSRVLYFEGAGWSDADISRKTIGNCRIRTAFSLDDGRRVYLEMHGAERTKHVSTTLFRWQYTGFVDHCFVIFSETADDIKSSRPCTIEDIRRYDAQMEREREAYWAIRRKLPEVFEWSLDGILTVVRGLGASFDSVEILPDYAGYRVHGEQHGEYNDGDKFAYDPDATARRAACVKRMEKLNADRLGMQYDNSSYWVDGNRLMMRINVSRESMLKAGLDPDSREQELEY